VVDVRRCEDDRHVGQFLVHAVEGVDHLEEIAESWIRSKIGAVVPPSRNCDRCKSVLEPAVPFDTNHQYQNALWIKFSGGYGMFIDPDDDIEVCLCHDCAHWLCAANPFIGDLLTPASSHSHQVDDIAGLIAADHDGWDLTPYRLVDDAALAAHVAAEHPELDISDGVWLSHWREHRTRNDHDHIGGAHPDLDGGDAAR
jgi:hypothetical protein